MIWLKLLLNLIITFFLNSWPSIGGKENGTYALKSSIFSNKDFKVIRDASSISFVFNPPMSQVSSLVSQVSYQVSQAAIDSSW